MDGHGGVADHRPVAGDRADDAVLLRMGLLSAAYVVGRLLVAGGLGFAVAEADGRVRSSDPARDVGFWDRVFLAGVVVGIGVVLVAWWASTFSENMRRLRCRTAPQHRMVVYWLLPAAWAALASLTLMQWELDLEVDPMPGLSALGFFLALIVPYSAVHAAFRAHRDEVDRLLWVTFGADLLAFGATWYVLSEWPATLPPTEFFGGRGRLSWAVVGAVALAVVALLSFLTPAKAQRVVRARATSLARRDESATPAWFATGLRPVPVPGDPPDEIAVEGSTAIVLEPLRLAVVMCYAGTALALAVRAAWAVAVRRDDGPAASGFATAEVGEQLDLAVLTVLAAALITQALWTAAALRRARRVSPFASASVWAVALLLPVPASVVAGFFVAERSGFDRGVAVVTIGTALGLLGQLVSLSHVRSLVASLGADGVLVRRWQLLLVLGLVLGQWRRFAIGRSVDSDQFLLVVAVADVMSSVQYAFVAVVAWSATRSVHDAIDRRAATVVRRDL